MRFKLEWKWVELRGDPSLGLTQIALQTMERILKKEKSGIMIELSQLLSGDKEGRNETPPNIQPILLRYQTIFFEPKELPPSRQRDHITLTEGTNPVTVRPYRYPRSKKMKSKQW